MICSRNKHGYRGVRMRRDGRNKPFYARIRLSDRRLLNSTHYATAVEAAAAFERMLKVRPMIGGVR